MSAKQMEENNITGYQVQSAIDELYRWRGHTMKHEDFEGLLSKHSLRLENDLVIFTGVFGQDGNEFAIVRATESPYGFEITEFLR